MKKLLILLSLFADRANGFSQCSGTSATAGGSFGNNISIGTLSWFGTGNAILPDNSYATAGQLVAVLSSVQTNYITAQDFGFSIPAGAIICGIEVGVQRHAAGLIIGSSIKDNSVKIIKNGSITGSEQSAGASWPGIDATTVFGGSANQWGTAWVPADINAANFGVAISARLSAGLAGVFLTAEIDYISVTVYYDFLLPDPPLYFKAIPQPPGMMLSWAMAPASQTKYFIVEKSPDTRNWHQMDSVASREDNAFGTVYQSYDPTPTGINYYRLLHAGANDKRILDYTLAAKYDGKQISGAKVYSDPASHHATVQCEETMRSIQLLNTNMRPVKTIPCESGDIKVDINTAGMPPGMYIARVITRANRVYTSKLMVW